jgi:hypothetical protein
MIIDKKSWHFQLARFSAGGDYYVPKDLCGYMRQIIQSLLGIISLGVVGATIVLVAVWLLYLGWSVIDWIWMSIAAKQFFTLSEPAFIGLFVFGLGAVTALLFSILYLWGWYEDDIYERDLKAIRDGASIPKRKRNLIGAIYRGFKEKTCVLLEFK